MKDFVVALGLVLAIEGLFFAAFPLQLKRAMESVLNTPDSWLRIVGIASAIIGIVMIWVIRG
ncbi:MAG: DUF2065 domain-containing protein [Pseudorhodoplanes sp.]